MINDRIMRVMGNGLRAIASSTGNLAKWVDVKRAAEYVFTPLPSDVFVVSYPRSGTTLSQMIVYQLLSNGNLDFPHLALVSPWFERRVMYNPDGYMEDFSAYNSPRIFKSHLAWNDIPKGDARYIYVYRDGVDVLNSFYHFYCSHLSFKGTFDHFFEYFIKGEVQFGSWFEHLSGWQAHRHDENVLFLKFEEMITEPDRVIREIASFLQLDLDDALLEVVRNNTSFAFMKQHQHKFNHTTGLALDMGYQLEGFIRKGGAGEGNAMLSPQQKARFDSALMRSKIDG